MFFYISLFGILSLFSLCEASCQPGQRIHNVEEPTPLSTLEAKPPRDIKKSNMVAGWGGMWFDDLRNDIVGIRRITVWYGAQIDGIEIVYIKADGSTTEGIHHGGFGGTLVSSVDLDTDEYISKVEGFTDGFLIDRLGFIVKEASGEERKYGLFGHTGIDAYSFEGHIVAFHGRAGNMLDGLGVYYLNLLEPSPLFGGTGGEEWSDPVDTNVPPVVGIKKIVIGHGFSIDSIQVDYQLLGGTILAGDRHGGDGGDPSTIELEEGEYIQELLGITNGMIIYTSTHLYYTKARWYY